MNLQEFSGGSTGTTTVHIRVAGTELARKKGNNSTVIVVVIVVVAVVVGLAIGSYFVWKWKVKRRRGEEALSEQPLQGASGSVVSSVQESFGQANLEELPLFKFEVLANATDSFSEVNKLGKGGFGPVFKGVLANGKEIAIKRLSKASGQGMQEFMNEVELISKLQHRNLVRLFGWCIENKETMLVYEYMPNKSLDFFLFDPSKEILDWRKRSNIMRGICRGLLYLHRDSRLRIIHRDLKPSNILLDNDWNPKISDFGMARIYETKQDHVSTVHVVGTYGYMAPEYAFEGRFSEKSDVFSFGILMMEIACGRRNSSFHYQGATMNLLGHIWKLWNEADIIPLIDPRISDPGNHSEVLRCIHIGLLCVQELPVDRPSVSTVLSMLNSEKLELPAPKHPAFVATKPSSNIGTGTSSSQMTSGSVNHVTLTVVDGR